MEEDLRNALLASAGLSALVARRIYWDLAPQGAELPYVVLTLVTSPRGYTYQGRDGLTGHLVQIDAYAPTKAAVKAVARALDVTLEALGAPFQKAFIESERSGRDTDDASATAATPLFRASLDVRVWRAEP